MIIEEIILIGYNRLLSDIGYFQWSPKAPLCLILGGNGSGKSSLLEELNPMPANKSYYRAGGSKKITVRDGDQRYVLTSTFQKGQLHSFIKVTNEGNIELNPSGTVTIQKELVENVLRYTQKIHKILTGKLEFTELSPSQRKELLMEISPLQLDYANALFDKSKIMLRDDQGALKHQILKHEDLESRLQGLESTQIPSDLDTLEKSIEFLLPFKGSTNILIGEVEEQIKSIYSKLEGQFNIWRKSGIFNTTLPIQFKNVMEIGNHIGKLEGELGANVNRLKMLNQKLMDIQSLHSNGEDFLTSEEVKKRIDTINLELSILKEDFEVTDNFMAWTSRLYAVREFIENSFPSEIIHIFSKEEIENITTVYEARRIEAVNVKDKLSRINERLKHMKEEEGVLCPKCQIRLSLSGKDLETEIRMLTDAVKKGVAKLDSLETEIKNLEPEKESIQTYLRIRSRIEEIMNVYNLLQPLWRVFPHPDTVIANPAGFNNLVLSLIQQIDRSINYHGLLNKLNGYKESLTFIERLGNNYSTPSQLEFEIEREIEIQQKLKSDIKFYRDWLTKYNELASIQESAERMLNEIAKKNEMWITGKIQKDVKERLDYIYDMLGLFKHIVEKKKTISHTLEETTKDIRMLETRQKRLEILSTVLSPNKGIIAEQLSTFINSYIEQINLIIQQVWQHDLYMLPIEKEKCSQLDYQFELSKEGNYVSDISEASKGQKEIINMAFVLIMRQYMNLTEYPMFMDETGGAFDEAHRLYLIRFIKELIDSKQCQQIFMVNHYANWHGGLSNHEVVVLDKRNIAVPNIYNENVEIK